MAKKMILVIDDEENIRSGIVFALQEEGYTVQSAENGEQGLEKLNLFLPDLVICDVKMHGIDGIEFLTQAKKKHPMIPIIMLTGHAGLDDAINAMKIGAYDFLTKPVHLEKLFLLIQRALSSTKSQQHSKELEHRLDQRKGFKDIIGNSPQINKMIDILKQVSPTDATVLLLGESGVGKEVFANAIHENSERINGPFVKVHCAALPETLLESELFGHEKGAFTGATTKRQGRFERADGGTIFLDEIGDISPHVQVKLLRVLQEREFERVGGEETITVDIRIITATNKNLEQAVKNGTFREDLYYRLNVVEITIPPLRERTEDIPKLSIEFLQRITKKYNKNIIEFSPEVLNIFLKYPWPGNIRELQNAIETAVVLSNTTIITKDFLPQHLNTL
ncbi:MAG: sigma-54-dependent Fis family transcriptional regulator [Spirochaetota bacterium]|nr:sigma-54-dependent Fis family transcriptional regulator [Spirochaetota bacterium]